MISSKEAILDEHTAALVAELFGTLGDASRVRIIAALVVSELNVSASAVSHHMRVLRQMRFVRARKKGREVFYSLDDEHIADLFQRGLEHIQHN